MNKSSAPRFITTVLGVLLIVFSIGLWTFELVVNKTVSISVVYPVTLSAGIVALRLSFRRDIWE